MAAAELLLQMLQVFPEELITTTDVVLIVQTSASIAKRLDWDHVAACTRDDLRPPPLKIPRRPSKLRRPCLPKRLTAGGLEVLCRKAQIANTKVEFLKFKALSVVTWGMNGHHQCDDGPTGISIVSVACGMYHNVGLSSDGTVHMWGNNHRSQRNNKPMKSGFVALACGTYHSVALHGDDGTIVTWGDNRQGQCDGGPSGDDFVAVACGHDHTVALHSDGTVVAWGSNLFDQCQFVPDDDGFVAVACRQINTAVLHGAGSAGTMSSWSDSDAPMSDVVAIACGVRHVVALRSDGTIVTWDVFDGFPLAGDIAADGNPPGDGFVAIACGSSHSVALHKTGTVVTWGSNSQRQRIDAPTGDGFVAIACGKYHSVALHGDGTVVTWGDMEAPRRNSPTTYPTGGGFLAVACGEQHCVALRQT